MTARLMMTRLMTTDDGKTDDGKTWQLQAEFFARRVPPSQTAHS